ncbi:hypothetical protein RMN57_02125 [Kitasatospora sp. CM 4170]|uniref:Uncharacterized protein n=1 Tax=Kitasatospora aburaviensis TaxID=67265 RepID=A0ABW1F7V4_9ACTN|nr:hypothetical protein [Kitasatospora sp. CM 4170]WNM43578.1 hypothetical protein RMN57_02125 [Kitasatospora sp. CM 4170]
MTVAPRPTGPYLDHPSSNGPVDREAAEAQAAEQRHAEGAGPVNEEPS